MGEAGGNRGVLQRYLDAVWGGHDPDAATDYFAPGYRRHLSPSAEPLDAPAQIARLHGFMTAFPDATITVEVLTGEGELVAFAGVMRGTHRGAFLGVEPTGRTVEVHLVDMVRIVDGRMVEHWGGPDLNDLRAQISG